MIISSNEWIVLTVAASISNYIGTACMFGKVLNFILFFKNNLAYGILYFFLSLRKYLIEVASTITVA